MPLHVGEPPRSRAWHPQGMPLHVGGPPRFPMRLGRGCQGDDRKRVGESGAILAFAPIALKPNERYSGAGGEFYIGDLPGEGAPVHVAGDDVSIP